MFTSCPFVHCPSPGTSAGGVIACQRDPCPLCPRERDHRDHPAGLLLVLAERRSPLHLRGEGTIALLADEWRRNRVEPVGADLDLDVRIGDEIPVPVRMLRRTSLRREDEQPVALP